MRLDKELRGRGDWVALGNLDSLEAVLEDKCKTPEDFESNFKYVGLPAMAALSTWLL